MWALVQALTFMNQLMSHQFDLIPELLAANVTGQFALGIAIEPVLAILRDVRSNGYVVPI